MNNKLRIVLALGASGIALAQNEPPSNLVSKTLHTPSNVTGDENRRGETKLFSESYHGSVVINGVAGSKSVIDKCTIWFEEHFSAPHTSLNMRASGNSLEQLKVSSTPNHPELNTSFPKIQAAFIKSGNDIAVFYLPTPESADKNSQDRPKFLSLYAPQARIIIAFSEPLSEKNETAIENGLDSNFKNATVYIRYENSDGKTSWVNIGKIGNKGVFGKVREDLMIHGRLYSLKNDDLNKTDKNQQNEVQRMPINAPQEGAQNWNRFKKATSPYGVQR